MKNPFKFLGSWIGLIVSLPLAYFSFAIVLHQAETGNFVELAMLLPPAILLAGFFLGYAIHKKLK